VLRRIILENFMSHARTVIEPADGLTILVGPNNCGKSAVVSALQSLCYNLTGDYMGRHGERETAVTVETDDGHTLTWRRKGSTVSYVIDGEEVHRLRGGVPDRLNELLHLPKVSTENAEDEFDIHFGTQKAPIFLINEPERRAAMFFAASSDAALLMQMQRRHTEKVKDSKRERDRLEKDLSRLDRELSALAPINDLSVEMQSAEQRFQSLEEIARHVASLGQKIESMLREHGDWALEDAELTALSTLREPHEPKETKALESLIISIGNCNERLAFESDHWIIISRLRSAPDLREVADLHELIQATSSCEADCRRSAATTRAIESLRAPPSLPDAIPFQNFVNDFAREANFSDRAGHSCSVLTGLQSPPSLADTRALDSTIHQLQSVHAETAEHDRVMQRTRAELAVAERDIREWVRTNRVCNTCGAVLDPDRLLSGAAE